jgi:hypothetical protein
MHSLNHRSVCMCTGERSHSEAKNEAQISMDLIAHFCTVVRIHAHALVYTNMRIRMSACANIATLDTRVHKWAI